MSDELEDLLNDEEAKPKSPVAAVVEEAKAKKKKKEAAVKTIPVTASDVAKTEEAPKERRSRAELMQKPQTKAERLAEMIADSRKVLKDPPPPGMKYFEAPDGYIMLADVKEHHVFCRHLGIQINPRREKPGLK